MRRILFPTAFRSTVLALTLFVTMLFVGTANAQLSIPNTTPVTENFTSLGSSATAALPTGFRIGAAWTGGTTATTVAGGTSGTGVLTSSSTGGAYNFANGITASSTDRALGFLSSAGYVSPRYIILAITNNTGGTIAGVTVSFDYEKYRSGTNAAGCVMAVQTSTDGTNFSADIASGGNTYGLDAGNTVVNPPTTISKTVNINAGLANGQTFYIRWSYTVAGSSNAQGIGIDNVSITAVLPTHYYSAPTGNLDATATWSTNTNGIGGSNPTNFTDHGQVFHVANGNTGVIGTNPWTVSGTGSRIIVDGTDLTITSTRAIAGSVTVYAGRTLKLQNTTLPTLDTLAATSTVIYNNGTANTLNYTTNYGHLVFDGASVTNPAAVSNLSFAGNLTLQNGGSINAALVNLVTKGTAAQTITGNSLTLSVDSFINTAANKTNTLTLASGTSMTLAGSLKMDNTGSGNLFNDGGNTITVKGYVVATGNAAGYSLSGTINAVPTAAMIFMGSATTLGAVAALPNVGITPAFVSTIATGTTISGNLDISTGSTAVTLSGTNTLTGNLNVASGYSGTLTLGSLSIGGNYTWLPTTNKIASGANVTFNGTAQSFSSAVTAGHIFSTTTLASSTGLTTNTRFNTGAFAWNGGTLTLVPGTTVTVGSTFSVTGVFSGSASKVLLGGGTIGDVPATTNLNGGVLRMTGTSTATNGITVGSATTPFNSAVLDLAGTGAWNDVSSNSITINPYSQLNLTSIPASATNFPISLNGIGNNITTTYGLGALKTSATITLANPITIATDATINAGSALTLSGPITFTGQLTKMGTAVLTISGASTSISGAGGIKLSQGSVAVLSGSSLGTGPMEFAEVVSAAGSITLNNTQTISELKSSWTRVTGSQTNTLNLASGSVLTINQSSNTTFGDGAVNTLKNVITGAGNIVKSGGSGTLTLTSGITNHTGTLTISAGTLVFAPSTSTNILAGAGLTVTGGAMQIITSTAMTLGNGGVVASGGTINIANAATVNLGSLAISGSAAVTLANTAAVTEGASGTLAISAGSLNITGSGTVTLGAGGITLSGGVLNITPSAPPATLTFTGATVTLSAPTYLSGGAISTDGIGGTTTINGGTVTLTSNSTITLGTGVLHSIKFGTSATAWTGGALLTIRGWQGTFQNGTASSTRGRVFFGTTAGLGANLAQVKFDDGSYVYDALQLSTGEVVPKAFITTGTPSPASPYYNDVNNAITVPYTYTGPTVPGGTVYTVEMSDNVGSYVSPIVTGTATASPISITIPSLTAVGSYKLRVRASVPVAINGTEVTINLIGHPPVVTAVSAYSGVAPGQVISITGSNFNVVPSFNKVFFGATGVSADTTSTVTELHVTVPIGATADHITVTDITTHFSANSPKVFVPDYTNDYFTTAQTFQAPVTFISNQNGTASKPWNTAVGDMDGDGDLDLIMITGQISPILSFIVYYENTGGNGGASDISGSSFSYVGSRTVAAIGTSIKIADLDGDGKPDVAVSMVSSGAVSVFRNITTGYGTGGHGAITFDTRTDISFFPHSGNAQKITLADFDKDGKIDIAGGCYGYNGGTNESRLLIVKNNTVSGVSFGTGSAYFDSSTYTSNNNNGALGSSVCSGDFDSDGKIDVAVIDQNRTGNGTISIFKNASPSPGTMAFTLQPGALTTGIGTADIATADFDGDGALDLVVTNQLSSTVCVYINPNDGTMAFPSTPSYTMLGTSGLAPAGLAVADMNGDGKTDAIVVNSNNAIGGAVSDSVLIFTNTTTLTGSPVFSAPFILHTGGDTASAGIIIADVDKDRYPDIIIANISNNSVSVIRNKPTINIGSITGVPAPLCYQASTTLSYSSTGLTSPAGVTPAYDDNPLPADLVGTWSSSDAGMATIDPSTGVVTGLATGTPDISFTINVTGTNISGTTQSSVTVNRVDISIDPVPNLCIGATTLPVTYSVVEGVPTLYSISYDPTALADGFVDVSNAALSGSTITLTIPITAVAGTPYVPSLTVSDGTCSSGVPAYDLSFQSYDPPVGTMTATDTTPCKNHFVSVDFTANPGATIEYSVNGGATIPEVLAGGTLSVELPHVLTTQSYLLLNVYDNHCTTAYNTPLDIVPMNMEWIGGLSGHTTDWNRSDNWTCLLIPSDTDYVYIPNTSPRPEILTSESGTSYDITLLSGASITLNGTATLNVKGNVSNDGEVKGSGEMILSGSAAQTLTGFGAVSNLTLDNTLGATISTGSRTTVKSVLTIAAGALATNDSLSLYSDSTGSARIAEIPVSGSSITGNVKVYQYIQAGYRRFRFWAHPFSTSISLGQLQPYMDITGTGGSANGFTTTGSNAPSAFRLDPYTGNSSLGYDPGWKPITKINGTEADSNKLKRYQGLRLFMRGAKGQGLGGFAYVIRENTVAMSGPVNQGTQVATLERGAGPDPTLMDFNMIGNPYASPTDIGAAVYAASLSGDVTGAAFYVYNASLGVAGQFQPVLIDGSPYVIQANASFQVRAADDLKQLTFTESMKEATPTTILFKPAAGEHVSLNVYDANYHMWDMWTLRFNEQASEAEDTKYDAVKPLGADFNFYSLSTEKRKMAIDTRPFAVNSTVPLGITSSYKQDFIVRADDMKLPENSALFLHDKMLKKFVELKAGTEYKFTVSADKSSQGNERFELALKPAEVVVKGFQVTMTPNPTSDDVKIAFTSDAKANVSVRVMDMSGVTVYTQDMGAVQSGNTTVSLGKFAAGIYMIEFTSGDQKSIHKLVKE